MIRHLVLITLHLSPIYVGFASHRKKGGLEVNLSTNNFKVKVDRRVAARAVPDYRHLGRVVGLLSDLGFGFGSRGFLMVLGIFLLLRFFWVLTCLFMARV